MNRKFIIASFNLYWNGSPNSWDNAARQVLRSENELKVYYYIVLFQLKWFSEQDSIASPPFRSEVNRVRMQFERPCDARRPVVSVSRFVRYRLLIYALIRSLRRRNVSLVKLCAWPTCKNSRKSNSYRAKGKDIRVSNSNRRRHHLIWIGTNIITIFASFYSAFIIVYFRSHK